MPQYDTPPTNSTSRYPSDSQESVRVPEILAESQSLTEAIEYLSKHVAELEQRLTPVLRPSVPEADGGAAKTSADPSAPHALELYRLRLRIDSITDHVRNITRRCECP